MVWQPTAGVDEAGRGPLAGPVVAAAVILQPSRPVAGVADSKKLTAARRVRLAQTIRRDACAWAVAWADAAEIDRLNILQASHLAMRRAISGLGVVPDFVEVDGNRLPSLTFPAITLTGSAIIGGDAKVAAISAASILAKVTRDAMMVELDRLYPQYGFAQHKGYPTRAHRESLSRFGPCPQHRRSFKPLRLSA
ncbi:MAG: ribonuclease HII [Woeseia sp.]|nr:ribonuclease HII [Woeseia sp.]NNL55055.1 ribonuclease HII [Woeseia sp.]